MNVKTSNTALFFSKLTSLFHYSKAKNYSFVAWKTPNSNIIHLICSKSAIFNPHLDLSKTNKGFYIAPFNDTLHSYIWLPDEYYSNSLGEEKYNNTAFLNEFEALFQENNSEDIRPKKSILGNRIAQEQHFELNVKNAVTAIKQGELKKVVIAQLQRYELVEIDEVSIFMNLCLNENAFTSLLFNPQLGVHIGASPEILVQANSEYFKTVALAGTQKYKEGMDINAASWTQKEIEEQALVSRYIIECFKKIRLREYDDVGPKTVRAGNLLHLKTEFSVHLKEVNYPELPEIMLKLLHPTSAICGSPLEKAKEFISKNEPFDRRYFCGFLGPVNFNEETSIYVNIRCATIKEGIITFYAGAGITEDSVPEKELQETENKIQFLKNYFN